MEEPDSLLPDSVTGMTQSFEQVADQGKVEVVPEGQTHLLVQCFELPLEWATDVHHQLLHALQTFISGKFGDGLIHFCVVWADLILVQMIHYFLIDTKYEN